MRTFVILGMKHPVSTAEKIAMHYSCWYSWTGHFLVPWNSHRVAEVGIIALHEIVLHKQKVYFVLSNEKLDVYYRKNFEKIFNKIYHLILIKILSKIGIERNFYNLIQSIYEKLTANITIIVKNLML